MEANVLPLCGKLGIGLVPYSPRPKKRGAWDGLDPYAHERGRTNHQFGLAWLMAHGTFVGPIPGTVHRDYLEENISTADLELTSVQFEELACTITHAD